jgi:gamma-glutamyltranspeptidase / glutathione hydrolase
MAEAQLPSPPSNRPTVRGKHWVASTGHYLATTAAAQILSAGGNAIDAGVAAGMCINVLQPDMTNIGGVAPTIVHSKAKNRTVSISGLGSFPMGVSREFFVKEHGGKIPRGVLQTVMPAAIDSWLTALKEFGTMSFAEVAAPAIELAENGFPMYEYLHHNLNSDAPQLRQWPSSSEVFLPDGRVPAVGELFFQKDLARTLRRLIEAEQGATAGREAGIQAARDRFFTGDIAEEMASFNQREGGFLTTEDLANFHVDIETPPSIEYRGYQILGCGPWCQGPVALQTLKILEGYDLASMGQNSPDRYHLILEALKAAFADRERYYGDPKFVDVPVDGLLSEAYAAAWRDRISGETASPGMPEPGDPWPYQNGSSAGGSYKEPKAFDAKVDRDTSYLCVIDEDGNAFSATPSDVCRAAPVVPGLGLIPSPRGSQTWLEDDHPSRMEPGKRPRLTPNPGMIMKDGEVFAVHGTPGLDAQPQAMVQLVTNLIDHGMDVQPAIEAPRAITYSFPLSSHPHPYTPGLVRVEGRFDKDVAAELARRGHKIERWPDWSPRAGALSAVVRDRGYGTLRGGADPRRNNYALGW